MKTVIALGRKKQQVFRHENIAYKKKKTPLPECTLSLHYMSAVLPIALEGHLRRNKQVNQGRLGCRPTKSSGKKHAKTFVSGVMGSCLC